jgi:hypothetical protein
MNDLNDFKAKHAAILEEREKIIARLNELDKTIAEMKALNPAPKRGRKAKFVPTGVPDDGSNLLANIQAMGQADSGEQTQVNEINSL